jgi:hypothetical protein
LNSTAALFSLSGCTIGAFSCAFTVVPLFVLQGTAYSGAFPARELQALVLLFFRVYSQCFNTSFVLFGFYCVLIAISRLDRPSCHELWVCSWCSRVLAG